MPNSVLLDLMATTFRRVPSFKGKTRIAHLVSPRTGIITARIGPACMKLDLGDMIQRDVAFGVYEPRELSLVRQVLPRGGCFVDVGANIGIYSAVAAQCVGPNGRVIAIEPDPYCFERLEKMGLPNVSILKTAVGDKRETGAQLFIPPAHEANRDGSLVYHAEGATTVCVPVTTLDEALAFLTCTIDLMKMDIEGGEPAALRGADRLLKSGHIRAVLCEFNETLLHAAGSSREQLASTFHTFGYRRERQVPDMGWLTNELFVR